MNRSANSRQDSTVDIALATFNGASHLEALLESIEQQTYHHWNLIAGDDGSSDKTIDILKAFAAAHPDRTTLLPAANRLGAKQNFSRILAACSSNYVMLADQDDVWLPGKTEKSLHRAQMVEKGLPADTPVLVHTDASVADTSLQIQSRSLWRHQHLCPEYGLKFKNLLVQNVITGCTVLVNRAVLKQALPIPENCIMHDWWMGLVAAAFGQISYINEPTLLYRQHAANQIGAKQWSVRYAAGEAASGLAALRERIRATQQQAEAFRMQFAKQLDDGEQHILHTYTQLQHSGPFRRRVLACRHRLHKCGILRTIGLYAAL